MPEVPGARGDDNGVIGLEVEDAHVTGAPVLRARTEVAWVVAELGRSSRSADRGHWKDLLDDAGAVCTSCGQYWGRLLTRPAELHKRVPQPVDKKNFAGVSRGGRVSLG